MTPTPPATPDRPLATPGRPFGRNLLAWILVLQVLTLIGQWAAPAGSGVGGAATALAQVPDAGAQQLQIIDQLKSLNQKLDKLTDLLAGGNMQVKLIKEAEPKTP